MISLIARVLLLFSLVAGAAAVSIAQEEAEKAGTAQQEGGQRRAEQQADEVAAEKVESKSEQPQPEETAEKAVPAEEAGAKEAGAKEAGAKEAAEAKSPATETTTEESAGEETGEEESPTKEAPAEAAAAKQPAAKQPAAKQPAAKQPAAARREDEKTSLPKAWVDKLQWRSIGPANMSGRITALAVYEKDSNIWWAATASGGLLKTINNGTSFEHQFDREATVSIGDVQVAATDPNIVWVGTGEANPRNSVSWGDGVYKSTDGGKSWTNMGLKNSFQIGRIAIHPQDPNIVYVGALGRLWGPNEERGLFKTTDGGKTWSKILYVDDKTGVIDVQMNPRDPDTLIVATYERQRDGFDGNDPKKKIAPGSGVYRTTDGGKTFEKVTQGLPTCNLGRIGISIYRRDPKQDYLVVESEKIAQWPDKAPLIGLQGEDADVGARITQVEAKGAAEAGGVKQGDIVIALNGLTVHSYQQLLTEVRKREAGDKIKVIVSRDRKSIPLEITLGERPKPRPSGGGSERTSSQQRSASTPYSGGLGGQQPNQEQGPNAGEHGGVYHSKDGGVTWKRVNSVNPRPMYYSQLRVDPSSNNFIWVLGTSLYLTKDGGITFGSDDTARGVHVDHHAMWINPKDGRHIILGNDGGIYVTYDRGLNWDHLNHVAIGQFYHVAADNRRDYSVYGGLQDNGSWGGPHRGEDGRGAINSDWISVGGGDGFVCQIDPHDPDLIYLESQNGATGRVNLRTGERASIRPRAPRGTSYRFNWKTPFILSPHNPKIYYSAGNYVFRSVYEGNNIRAISPDLTLTNEGSGSALAESPLEEGVLYVGTTDGAVWCTQNGGREWKNLHGKPNAPATQSAKEQSAASQAAAAEQPAPGSAEAGEEDRPRRGGRGGGPGRFLEMLKQSDANGDGKLQKEEFPERMIGMFERLDTNSDGVVDQTELNAMQSRFGRPGGAEPPKQEQSPQPAEVNPEQTAKEPPATPAEPEKAAAEEPGEPAKNLEEPQQETKPEETKPEQSAKEEPAKPVIKDDTLSGTWEGQFKREGLPPDRSQFTLVMRMDAAGKISATFKSSNTDSAGEGSFDPQSKQVSLSFPTERGTLELTGNVTEKTLAGDVDLGGTVSMPIEAQRVGDAPAVAEKPAEAKPGKALEDLLPGPRWVSSLEASRFQRGRAYITFDGHRSDDDLPYVFVTEDYGTTWRSLVANLPPTAGSVHVLREDIRNENVLYLGTEFAIWVSIDRGGSWTKLNSNLPTVAVHEVAVHPTASEIIAGTHGRSLWILDVAALRQLTPETIAANAFLYNPQPAIQWRSKPSRGSSGIRKFVGAPAPSGAMIYYSLGRNARYVGLEITDVEGKTIAELEGDTTAGLQRINWDLRRTSRQSRAGTSQQPGGGSPPSFSRGGSVAPGKYLITLTVDDEKFQRVLTVEEDPGAPSS